jgi:hypothetical protein
MAILRSSPTPPRPAPAPNRLTAVLADLCRREGLYDAETAGVLAVALTWAPGLSRDPVPLLRAFTMPA